MRIIELIWLKIREYFKHPAENIRQARPIVPGRLYRNFGRICKAVRYTAEQKEYLSKEPDEVTSGVYDAEGLIELVRQVKGDRRIVEHVKEMVGSASDLPAKCSLCDFHKMGIPCPIYNVLKDGRTVCDVYRYEVIRRQ